MAWNWGYQPANEPEQTPQVQVQRLSEIPRETLVEIFTTEFGGARNEKGIQTIQAGILRFDPDRRMPVPKNVYGASMFSFFAPSDRNSYKTEIGLQVPLRVKGDPGAHTSFNISVPFMTLESEAPEELWLRLANPKLQVTSQQQEQIFAYLLRNSDFWKQVGICTMEIQFNIVLTQDPRTGEPQRARSMSRNRGLLGKQISDSLGIAQSVPYITEFLYGKVSLTLDYVPVQMRGVAIPKRDNTLFSVANMFDHLDEDLDEVSPAEGEEVQSAD